MLFAVAPLQRAVECSTQAAVNGPRTRLALRLAYDGGAIEGWQRQPGHRTVQGLLESALKTAGIRGKLHGASRTDAGVHAFEQVAHLDVRGGASFAPDLRAHFEAGDLPAIRRHLDAALPADVRLGAMVVAPPRFHARWSSRGKIYTYLLATPDDLEAASADPFLGARSWILPDPRAFPDRAGQPARLDVEAMARALKHLLGRRDFAGLATHRSAGPVPGGSVRKLGAGRIVEGSWPGAGGGRLVAITVAGDAFLKHMVRNLTGLLAQVGYGEIDPDAVATQVAERPRHRGPRAPGRGLTLMRVRYPVTVRPRWAG
jgi:tRNA pseudouridine38-40 synthase